MAKKIIRLAKTTNSRFLKVWSWVLLTLFGVLTTLTGCRLSNNDDLRVMYGAIPAYGVIQPMYGVQVAKYLVTNPPSDEN